MSHRLPIADIAFIADFAAFCRTKGDEAYDFCDSDACALAQFGFPGVGRIACRRLGIPEAAFDAANPIVSSVGTFSALADRLEALIADAPVVVQP
jgi:acyl dehydratase